jgi:hypothetical protein
MKKGLKYAVMLALFSLPVVCNAQSEDMVKNKALSAQYKSDITIASHELKALKARVKANPSDVNLNVELEKKKIALKELKDKKKIVDDAIKTEKASLKAAKAAEKAKIKAEKAAQKAQTLHTPVAQ